MDMSSQLQLCTAAVLPSVGGMRTRITHCIEGGWGLESVLMFWRRERFPAPAGNLTTDRPSP